MNAIDIKGVVKVYNGKVKALNGINLKVKAGTIHSILGPNGAGKTTLIRIITTQLKPTEGTVKVFGQDVTQNQYNVRSFIGYVPQEISLWTDITGYENLLIYSKIYGVPKEERNEAIANALDFMGLESAADRLVNTYSGGMLRKLEIASALMCKPKLLILDEPTIGLDPNARMMVWKKILEYKEEYKITVFFATHYMDEAEKYSDNVSLISSGKVVISGTPQKLKSVVRNDVISIRFQNGTSADFVSELLKKFKEIKVKKSVENEVQIYTENSQRLLPKVIKELLDKKVKILEVKVNVPSLEDAFIKLTGEKLEETGSAKEAMSVRRMIRLGG